MSTISVGRVQQTTIQPQHQQLSEAQLQSRLQLFSGDSIEKGSQSTGVAGAGTQTLPSVADPAAVAAFSGAIQSAPVEAQQQILEAGNQLAQGLAKAAGEMKPGDPPSDQLQKDIEYALGTTHGALSSAGKSPTAEEMVAGAAEASIGAINQDLVELSQKVESNLAKKKAIGAEMREIREDIAEIQDAIDDINHAVSTMADGETKQMETVDANGNPVVLTMTKEEWQQYANDLKSAKRNLETKLENLDSEYQTISDMNQMDTLMLQDMMQKQQQMFMLLSNLSRMMHDTAKNTLQNLK